MKRLLLLALLPIAGCAYLGPALEIAEVVYGPLEAPQGEEIDLGLCQQLGPPVYDRGLFWQVWRCSEGFLVMAPVDPQT